LQGKVDKYAPVKITGQINPLTSDAFTDLSILFQNVELTALSPYSAKYAGYPITKGKLSLDLRYNLSKKHLEAENKVLIDQLTLGEKVESPDATSLPVKLALALVTDRKGQIDIDLPVRGNLNDPDFHYGRLVLQVLGNVITKAVTSPFAALSNLIGGRGEELSEVEFASGSAALPTEKKDSIKSLAKALEERPALRVDITGTADPAGDRAALAEVKLREDLKSLKLKEMPSGVKPPQEEIELTGGDEERLVRDLYRSKFGPEPNAQIQEPEKPDTAVVEGLKAKLLETYQVEQADLRRLAQERAEQVRDHLIADAGVSPEQVFILDAAIEPAAKSGRVPTKLALAPK
jgi:outer membrane protein OmpA-like peptidoglycan-associated protein